MGNPSRAHGARDARARRVEPRQLRRALAERSEDGRRHGGRGEGSGDPSRATERLRGEALAARRVEPGRRRRALVELSEDGHRHGGREEGAGDPSRAPWAREAER